MSKRSFRHTPTRFQNSVKILAGTKTNSTIKNLEESEEEVEEIEGTVVSINKNKINGDGWTVQGSDGNLYQCSCASNMYEIPESKERGGILYPNETIKVTLTKNPVLKTNTIKEITSSKENSKIDINKWKHDKEATTVIAKPKSALSISDGMVKMNYNNVNSVIANKDGVKLQGKKTKIEADEIELDAKKVIVQDQPLTDYIQANQQNDEFAQESGAITPDDMSSLTISNMGNMSQATLEDSMYLDERDRVIGDIKDQKKFPTKDLTFPLMTSNGIDELTVRSNGIVSAKSKTGEGTRDIFSTHSWISPQTDRNVLDVNVTKYCNECNELNSNVRYMDYCPVCKSWNRLSYKKDNVLCNQCGATFCGNCGTGDAGTLKKYDDSNIKIVGENCDYCEDMLATNKTKQYADYCPVCKSWNTLVYNTFQRKDNPTNQIQCTSCNSVYCGNCGTEQAGYEQKSFYDNKINYDNYIKKMHKLNFIR